MADLYDDRAFEYYTSRRFKAAYDDYNLALEIDPSPGPHRYYWRAITYTYLATDESIESEIELQPAIDDYRKALDTFESGQIFHAYFKKLDIFESPGSLLVGGRI